MSWLMSARFIRFAMSLAIVGGAVSMADGCHRTVRDDLRALDPPDRFRDSLIRAVPLDSLAHLYRAMLAAQKPKPIGKEVTCELLRLSYLHGNYIVDAANARLLDTLYHESEHERVKEMDARLAGESEPLRASECHMPYDKPRAPDSLDMYPPLRKKP